MGKRLQRSLLLLGLLFGCMAAVASGTAVPENRPATGYARLIESRPAGAGVQESLVADCLMEEARLRGQARQAGPIPDGQFEELRRFCREAALVEGRETDLGGAAISSLEREAARERVRERHHRARLEAVAQEPVGRQAH